MKLKISLALALLSAITTGLFLQQDDLATAKLAQVALMLFLVLSVGFAFLGKELKTVETTIDTSKKDEIEAKAKELSARALEMEQRAQDAQKEIESLKTQNKSYEARLSLAEAERKKAESSELDEAAVVQFVRSLQERGRFLDFVMADIHSLPDQQVGAVARVVHSGLKTLVADYFSVEPIAIKDEGSRIQIPEGEIGRSYRLLQSKDDVIPESGVLVHKGWKARSIRLPKSVKVESRDERHVLAFAEVDASEGQGIKG